MPFSSDKLKNILKIQDVKWDDAATEVIANNHKINPASHLFNKIEDAIDSFNLVVSLSARRRDINKKHISLDDFHNISSSDPVEQTHKVMQNIQQLISEAGGKMEDLCKVVVYITDTQNREAVYKTMGKYLKGIYPVSTGLCVTALARPEWLVEIDATFVIPD